MLSEDEILKKYPEIKNHHEYCKELFINSKQYTSNWDCMCKFLRTYDSYIEMNKE